MRKFALLAVLLLAGCQNPETPRQALVTAYAAFGSAVASFNVYAAQRPFCGDEGARPPPLCADRTVVIQGDRAARVTATSLEAASAAIRAIGDENKDAQWRALAEPAELVRAFSVFVAGVR